jgi:hypothetical protein
MMHHRGWGLAYTNVLISFFYLQQQQNLSMRWSLRVSSRPPEPACSNYILAPLLIACPPCISVLHNSSDHHISNTSLSLSYYSQDYPAVKLSHNGWRVFEMDKDENTTHLVCDHINNRYIPSPAAR